MTELAPESCIVCGKERPKGQDIFRQLQEQKFVVDQYTWIYLAGAEPVGSMACGAECAAVAIERFNTTGRCDAKGKKS